MFTDFRIKYDPKTDTYEDITKRILYSIVVRRLKFKKPSIMFISGDSGEGKSYSALKLQQLIMEIQGMSLIDWVQDVNVHTPLEYPQKIKALLFDKRLKKVNLLCVHEARDLVNSKHWHNFLTQAISDINAQSRSIKRLCIMIVSQFIRDITTDIRYTINYYIKVHRPLGGNKRARLNIFVMWKDDRDLEKPKLRKRKLSGYLVYPSGKLRRYTPKYLELTMPDKEIVKIFEKADYESKADVLKGKIDKLVKEMSKELGKDENKIKAMVKHYTDDLSRLKTIGDYRRGKWRVSKKVAEMHELTPQELKEFETVLNDSIPGADKNE